MPRKLYKPTLAFWQFCTCFSEQAALDKMQRSQPVSRCICTECLLSP